jgi:NADPH2 dehydrogenase
VKKLDTVTAFRRHCAELGIDIPIDDAVDPAGALGTPITVRDGTAGTMTAPNRFAVLPMEGWDGTTDGRPTDLVRRRWQRFGASGCGLVWGEATAVRADGRANPHQLIVDERTVDDLAELRQMVDPAQVTGLQLTHSGRWARPDGAPPAADGLFSTRCSTAASTSPARRC